MNKILICSVIWFFLAGCTNYGSLRVSTGFDGIHRHLERVGSADVLIIHGIGTRTEDYSRELQDNVAEALGGTRVGFKRRQLFDPSLPKPTTDDPILLVTTYALPSGGELVFYEVNWWPLATGKAGLMTSGKQGALLNRVVKDQLVTSSLADAILYLSLIHI